MGLLACASLAPMLATSNAASLTPLATGLDAVTGVIGGRPNLALAGAGGVPFSSSDLNASYAADRVNDGAINNDGNSWIQLTPVAGDYVGVTLPGPSTVAAIVFGGQPGYNGRSGGTWSVQYTLEADPVTSTNWTEIGSYVYTEAGCATPMPRSIFSFGAIENVTGIRVQIKSVACGAQLAVQELEAYGPVELPVEFVTQPVGGTVQAGGDFTFSVVANNAESFQWLKGNKMVAGATGPSYLISDVKTNDAGAYSVIVSNVTGAVTSDTAILEVTPAPVYTNYTEAVLADSPIHYYPLDETEGTTAADLGSMATTGGTYAGGITLGQATATERLGTAVRFDGAPGTLVDLGLFHPGDNITVEAWVNLDPSARTDYSAVVARWDGSYELDFANSTANLVVRNNGNTFGLVAGASASTRGQWHHMIGIFSDGVLSIYIDGIKGSEANIGGGLQNAGPAPDRIMIGATRTGTEGSFNFKGLIDEVAIYDYALTVAQIRSHFRAVQAGAPEATIQRAVKVSWPSFPPGYVLQSAPKVDGPYQTVTNTPATDGAKMWLAFPSDDPAQSYFRLVKP